MSRRSLFKGGILGVIAGAIGGILFAPKSGKATRDELKGTALRANKEAERRLKELHKELSVKVEEVRERAVELSGKAKVELEALGQRAEFARTKVGELITSVKEFEVEDKEVDKAIKDSKEVVDKIDKSVNK